MRWDVNNGAWEKSKKRIWENGMRTSLYGELASQAWLFAEDEVGALPPAPPGLVWTNLHRSPNLQVELVDHM